MIKMIFIKLSHIKPTFVRNLKIKRKQTLRKQYFSITLILNIILTWYCKVSLERVCLRWFPIRNKIEYFEREFSKFQSYGMKVISKSKIMEWVGKDFVNKVKDQYHCYPKILNEQAKNEESRKLNKIWW